MIKLAALGSVFVACADPIVEMRFDMPANASQYDTSCISAVEVRAIGADHETNPTDITRSCVALPHPAASYTALVDALRGQFDVAIPDAGLAGLAVYGWSGPDACTPSDKWYFTPDLAFFAHESYLGEDVIALSVVPNLDCSRRHMAVRVVDMLALVASGSTAGCASAMTYSDHVGWSGVGTMIPQAFGKGTEFFGNVAWAYGVAGVAQFDTSTYVGHKSCLALSGANNSGGSIGCAVDGPAVCAGAGELEIAAVASTAVSQIDHTLAANFPNIIFGSVWNAAGPKMPVAGATVTVDPSHGEAAYLDPPDASGIIHVRGDQSGTGPSGLFVVYADTIIGATVAAGGKSRVVSLGATENAVAGAMIVLP